jgi:hypothetical protein
MQPWRVTRTSTVALRVAAGIVAATVVGGTTSRAVTSSARSHGNGRSTISPLASVRESCEKGRPSPCSGR